MMTINLLKPNPLEVTAITCPMCGRPSSCEWCEECELHCLGECRETLEKLHEYGEPLSVILRPRGVAYTFREES